jgi:hypothetical protein
MFQNGNETQRIKKKKKIKKSLLFQICRVSLILINSKTKQLGPSMIGVPPLSPRNPFQGFLNSPFSSLFQ